MSNQVMLEDLMKVISNKYFAANIAAIRAKQLNEGAVAAVKTDAAKETTAALEELLAEKLDYQILQRGELRAMEERMRLEATLVVDDADEAAEPLLDEEYVDDRGFVVDDDEPEEGI